MANFLGVGLVLGIVGIFRNYTVNRRRCIFLELAFSANVAFLASYGARDSQPMFLATYVIWAIWMADGVQYLAETVKGLRLNETQKSLAAALVRRVRSMPGEKLALLLPVAALVVNFSYADASSDTLLRDRSAELLTSFESNSLVLARWPDEALLAYLQIVEKMRPDVQLIDRFLIAPSDEQQLITRQLLQRPVYVFGPLPALPLPYQVVPITGGIETEHRLLPVPSGVNNP